MADGMSRRAWKRFKQKRAAERRAWREANAARIRALANADWHALANNPDPRDHARQHLAEMDPARRKMLEGEWVASVVEANR